jgi:hypothetical protein
MRIPRQAHVTACYSALALSIASGCNGNPGGSSQQDQLVPARPTIPEDRSLSLEEYTKVGVPAPDKPWSADDMIAAAASLTTLVERSPEYLPRYQSARSGSLFARITSAENLQLLKDPSEPIDQRFDRCTKFDQASDTIFNLYALSFPRGAIADSELVELMGMHFRGAVVMIALAREYAKTLNQQDPKYPMLIARCVRIKQGLASTVAGALQSFSEKATYRTTELRRLADYLQDTLPAIVAELSPEAQTDVLARIEKTRRSAATELGPSLDNLYEQVRTAAKGLEKSPQIPQ